MKVARPLEEARVSPNPCHNTIVTPAISASEEDTTCPLALAHRGPSRWQAEMLP